MTLIPSLLLIRGPKPMRRTSVKKRKAGGEAGDDDALSGMIADVLVHGAQRKYSIMILTIGVTLVSLYGLSRVIIDNIMVEYFKPHTDIHRSDVFVREKFGGSKLLSVVLEADNSETLLHPDSLNALEGLGRYLSEKVPHVGKVMGFTDLVKRINQVFNVDESPGGLRAAVSAGGGTGSADTGAFGFGFDGAADSDFGFGGFGAFDEEAADPAETGAPDAAGPPDGRGAKIYTEAELFALFDQAENRARSQQGGSFLRELKRLVNYDGTAYYEIPSDPEKYGKSTPEELQRLVSNYLVLLSGSIDQYANDPLEPTAIKSTVQLRTIGQYDSGAAYREMLSYIKAKFPPQLKTTIGGVTAVEFSLNRLVVQSQLSSVIISIIIVFIIISISNRSPAAGAIGITPLSISILINFAVMGFVGIKLNIGTSMVASVSVGIGIDYTIHYLDAFKREYRSAGGKAGILARGSGKFLYRSFVTSGKAILINAISVGAGFAVLLLSQFDMLADLGLLIAITMGTSALVSLTLLPVLLMLFQPKFLEQPEDLPKPSIWSTK
jgi:predicted RND superfamily exporter protein